MNRRTPTLDGPPMLGRRVGLRMTPELRRALKVAAATKGETMEDLLHRILCRALKRPDLLGSGPRSPAPR